MIRVVLTISLLASVAAYSAPTHLVEPSHLDNAVSLEYGQTFEAQSDQMFGVRFYMRNQSNATGPFSVLVYSISDTSTPLTEKEFSSDGNNINGLVEVNFDTVVNTTVGDDYLFTIKRNTNETFDIGLYSMDDSYPEGDNAIRSGGEFAYATRDISFDIISSAWDQMGSDINGEAPGDLFGSSVSLSADGTIIAIGATTSSDYGNNPGHIRLYQWSGSIWNQLGSAINGEFNGDKFGYSVSLSEDGTIVAIGAPYLNTVTVRSGYVRLYKWDGSTWNQIGSDINGEEEQEDFGYSVSLNADGSILAIGTPRSSRGHVSLYQWNGSTWSQLGSDINGEDWGEEFGCSLSLSADGTIIAIGGRKNYENGTYAGHARLYNWDGSAWNQLGDDIEGETYYDEFGYSVSLSADGTVVAIGAPYNDEVADDSGHVRLYKWNGSNWNQLGSDINGEGWLEKFGSSLSVSGDGTTVAIRASCRGTGKSGKVRIYKWDGLSWNKIISDFEDDAYSHALFGSVSLSADGSTVAIADPDNDGNGMQSGHVRIYESKTPTTISNQAPIITSTNEFFFTEGSTSAVAVITAADADGDDISYSLSGTNATLFEISETMGQLSFKSSPDFEVNPIYYELQVIASDFNQGSLTGGLSATNTISISITDDRSEDYDEDGLPEAEEEDIYATSDLDPDSDDDGLSDGDEVNTYGTDPNDADSDDDDVGDYYEVTGEGSYFIANNMTWSNANEYAELLGGELALIKTEAQYTQVTNFLSRFSAPAQNSYVWIGGSYSNAQWYWSDGSLITPSYNAISNFVFPSDTSNTFLTIKASDLTDAIDPLYNLYADYEQVRSALIYIPGNVTDPNNSDSDNDGLDDYAEINGYGTDPNNVDTDGDGLSDGAEISASHQTNANYEIISGSYTWYQAKWDAHSRGGHLAVVTSSSEYDQIKALAPGDKFLGGTDEGEEGIWKWVTSETFANLNSWALGQPDDSEDGQDYLRITDDSPPYSYLLDDCDNHEAFISGYILEIPNQSPTDPNSAWTPTNEYHLIEHELTWDQCLAYARHYGGELAALTSQGEEAYVTSWLDGQIGEQNAEVFLGGSDEGSEGEWSWSSGEAWEYENWYAGEPNNLNGPENYLELTHNSVVNWDWKWNDFDGNGADATYYMLIEAADTSLMPTGVVITASTDSDGDGLADIAEIQTYETDPNDADSDDDGVTDGDEVANGTDPFTPNTPISEYALTLYFKNTSAGFFNDSISLSDTIGGGCLVELLWSSTNILNTALGDETILTNATTASDTHGFGHWSGASINSSELPSESGYVWARVYNKAKSRYVDLGQIDIADTITSMSADLILAIPHATREKQFYVMQTDGVEIVLIDDDNDGLSNSDEINQYETDPQNPDSDGDGLSDGDEVINYQSDPNSNDGDGDGFDDGIEVAKNWNPTSSAESWVVDYIKARPDTFDVSSGGMTLSEAQAAMRDLRVGSQTFDVSNGTATIRMYVDESSDLTSSWTNTQHVLEVDIPADQDTMFYRFRMD